jgi:SAM-dependent methyltransferase
MDDVDLEQELEALYATLRQRERMVTTRDYMRLYELTGKLMQQRYGAAIDHNPCSVPSISSTLLKMAQEIAPCRILNVGMGGYPFVDIELTKRGFSVTGVEYSHSLTTLAREVSRHQRCEVECVVADGRKLPFGDRSFDACLCSETVEHVPDDAAVIREIHRILKPGGILLLTVPCVVALLGLAKRFAHYLRNGTVVMHPTHLREYTYFSAKPLVSEYFSIERWYNVPFTTEAFGKMPYEKVLSLLVSIPILKHLSLSLAFVLKRRDCVRECSGVDRRNARR